MTKGKIMSEITLDAALRHLMEPRESSEKLMGAAFIGEESVVRYGYEEMEMEVCAIVIDEKAAAALSDLVRVLENLAENQGIQIGNITVDSTKVPGLKTIWGDEFRGKKYAFGDPKFSEPVPLGNEFAPCSLADFEETEKVIRNKSGDAGKSISLCICSDGISVDDNWIGIKKFRNAMAGAFGTKEEQENQTGIKPA